MSAVVAHIPFLSALPLWERGKDFGWGNPSGGGFRNALDGIRRDNKSAAVEPVTDIITACNPFKVVGSAIESVFVPMMNGIQSVWIGNEGNGHKSVDKMGFGNPILGQFHFGIPTSFRSIDANTGTDKTVASLSVIDKPLPAKDSSNAGNHVESFISGNIKPLFAIDRWRGLILRCAKYLKDCFVNVKNIAAAPEVGNSVSVVASNAEKFGLKGSSGATLPVWDCLRHSFYAPFVGNLVSIHSRDLSPLLSLKVFDALGGFWENFPKKALNIEAAAQPSVEYGGASIYHGQNFILGGHNPSHTGDRVFRCKWDWDPSFVSHLSTRACSTIWLLYSLFVGSQQVHTKPAMAGGASCQLH